MSKFKIKEQVKALNNRTGKFEDAVVLDYTSIGGSFRGFYKLKFGHNHIQFSAPRNIKKIKHK